MSGLGSRLSGGKKTAEEEAGLEQQPHRQRQQDLLNNVRGLQHHAED